MIKIKYLEKLLLKYLLNRLKKRWLEKKYSRYASDVVGCCDFLIEVLKGGCDE